ncbi:protein translocase subunit SecD [Ornithinimicrobium sediminis]|uniref:protein translocase subunit SecD n=1 Tax=Ornithinimicrobium sediminis TaxID=2904603 RepID=UPI001E653B6E|nr:protein translocase subunit SecD [Ornithinimicrobium sediminis]MCE0487768.1 protein translocase subunit SecD [Ornithinimicrobium sediminis]
MNPRNRGPLKVLAALAALTLVLFGAIGAARIWGEEPASWTPQLGLDLAGGRQIIIEPVVEGASGVGEEQVDQAIDIIRRRIDGGGVAEAEVSRLGDTNISVAIPGNPSAEQLEALSRSSQLSFRPVLVAAPVQTLPTDPGQAPVLPLPDDVREQQLEDLLEQAPQDPGAVEEGSTDDAETTDGAYPAGLSTATSPDDASETTEAPIPEAPAEQVSDPSSLEQITPELQQEFIDLDCADDTAAQATAAAPSDQAITACSEDGFEKYILGPVELTGAQVSDAAAGLEQGQGGPTGRVEVQLTFDDEGRQAFAETTSRLFAFGPGAAQNRFAILLDGVVITAPSVNNVISNGSASITGDFTTESAETLANQLKFGALPISFEVQTSEQISPTLGGEQLRLGVIAGIIGLLLVFGYSLLQYRALGLVTIGSLSIAALLAYGAVTFLGWSNNFRLTMAGVTGLIVAIGITADSFIVYFERIRDEVRAGRPLRYAVDTGWARARQTILISDAVNLIAAGVLYFLSESSVRAFAFALGLTTVIDLIVVFMFTHPTVSILANTTFFGEGHKWSGMDPERLGAKRSTYLGRGQFAAPEPPRRTRPSRAEIEGGVV